MNCTECGGPWESRGDATVGTHAVDCRAIPPPGWDDEPWPDDQQIRNLIWATVSLGFGQRAQDVGYANGRSAGWRHAENRREAGESVTAADRDCPYLEPGRAFRAGWALGVALNESRLAVDGQPMAVVPAGYFDAVRTVCGCGQTSCPDCNS